MHGICVVSSKHQTASANTKAPIEVLSDLRLETISQKIKARRRIGTEKLPVPSTDSPGQADPFALTEQVFQDVIETLRPLTQKRLQILHHHHGVFKRRASRKAKFGRKLITHAPLRFGQHQQKSG